MQIKTIDVLKTFGIIGFLFTLFYTMEFEWPLLAGAIAFGTISGLSLIVRKTGDDYTADGSVIADRPLDRWGMLAG